MRIARIYVLLDWDFLVRKGGERCWVIGRKEDAQCVNEICNGIIMELESANEDESGSAGFSTMVMTARERMKADLLLKWIRCLSLVGLIPLERINNAVTKWIIS